MEMINGFNWVQVEKDLPEKQIGEVRFAREKPGRTGAKQFAYANPEAIYSDVDVVITTVQREPIMNFEIQIRNAI